MLNVPVVTALEDLLNYVEVVVALVALLIEDKVLEDVNIDVEVILLLEDVKVSEMDVLVVLLIVKVDVEVVVDAI